MLLATQEPPRREDNSLHTLESLQHRPRDHLLCTLASFKDLPRACLGSSWNYHVVQQQELLTIGARPLLLG